MAGQTAAVNKYLRIAWKLTHLSSAKQQRMAAVIVKGGAVIDTAVNRLFNHCERRAIRPNRDYSGATIYVMRHNRLCSRPCGDCQQLIINAGITRAVYIAKDGSTVVESYSG